MATSLLTLRTRARTRADAVGNNFFSDGEIDEYLNVGLGELHDILVSKFEDYYVNSVEFSLVKGQSNYTFDSISCTDFYKSLGVDATESGETIRIRKFEFAERDRYTATAITGRGGYTDYQYQIRGDSIEFIPEPSTTSTIKFWYVPSFSRLGFDTDQISSSIMTNWEEFAVITAVYKMKEKEELSTTVIERELEAIRMRIDGAASNRDAGEPGGITDEIDGTRSGWLRGFA